MALSGRSADCVARSGSGRKADMPNQRVECKHGTINFDFHPNLLNEHQLKCAWLLRRHRRNRHGQRNSAVDPEL